MISVWRNELLPARWENGAPHKGAPAMRKHPGAGRLVGGDVVEDSPTPTSVYRYYDRFGVLIYVGITSRDIHRQREHNDSKAWWPFVARQEVDHLPTRSEALARERTLIQTHLPPFNKQGNPHHDVVRSEYLRTIATAPDIGAGKLPPGILSTLPNRRLPLTQFPPESEFLCSAAAHAHLVSRIDFTGERVPVRSSRRIITGVRSVSMRGPVLVIETRIPLPALASAEAKLRFLDGKQDALRIEALFIEPEATRHEQGAA